MVDNRRRCVGCKSQFHRERGTNRTYCYKCRPSKKVTGPESMEDLSSGGTDSLLASVTPEAIYDQVRAELDAVGALDTADGMILLRCVAEMFAPGQTGSQLKARWDVYAQQRKATFAAAAAAAPAEDSTIAAIFGPE
jgi:hypothetical protein